MANNISKRVSSRKKNDEIRFLLDHFYLIFISVLFLTCYECIYSVAAIHYYCMSYDFYLFGVILVFLLQLLLDFYYVFLRRSTPGLFCVIAFVKAKKIMKLLRLQCL